MYKLAERRIAMCETVAGQAVQSDALFGPFLPPFVYEEEGACISDADGKRIVDVRGWGYLTGGGGCALNLHPDKAKAIQDRIGAFLVAAMNSPNAPRDLRGDSRVTVHADVGARKEDVQT